MSLGKRDRLGVDTPFIDEGHTPAPALGSAQGIHLSLAESLHTTSTTGTVPTAEIANAIVIAALMSKYAFTP